MKIVVKRVTIHCRFFIQFIVISARFQHTSFKPLNSYVLFFTYKEKNSTENYFRFSSMFLSPSNFFQYMHLYVLKLMVLQSPDDDWTWLKVFSSIFSVHLTEIIGLNFSVLFISLLTFNSLTWNYIFSKQSLKIWKYLAWPTFLLLLKIILRLFGVNIWFVQFPLSNYEWKIQCTD